MSKNRITDEQKQQVVALLATGNSCRAIARELKMSDQTVRRIRDEQQPEELARAHLDRKKEFAQKAWDSIDKALAFANQRIEVATVAAEKFEPLLERLINLLEESDGINGRDIKDILTAFAPLLNIPLKDVSTFIGTMYDKRALAEGEPTGHQKVSGQVVQQHEHVIKEIAEDEQGAKLLKELYRRRTAIRMGAPGPN